MIDYSKEVQLLAKEKYFNPTLIQFDGKIASLLDKDVTWEKQYWECYKISDTEAYVIQWFVDDKLIYNDFIRPEEVPLILSSRYMW